MSDCVCVSIITPAYNAEKYIDRVYQCLVSQTYTDFEWIVVNDASSDTTEQVVKEILSNTKINIKYISNQENLGVSMSRNKGLDIAKGKYICFLDADDAWEPEKLEVQVTFMQNNEILLSYMDYNQVDINGNVIRTIIAPDECDYSRILYSDVLGNLTCMVESSVVQNIRFMKHGHEDYIFWLNVLSRIPKAVKVKSDAICCHYTISSSSLSGNKLRSAIWQWKIYRNILKLNLFETIWYFSHYAVAGLKKHFF